MVCHNCWSIYTSSMESVDLINLICSERRGTTDICRPARQSSQPHQPTAAVFTGCGLLVVLHFCWRYSPTVAFTAEHPSTPVETTAASLIFTHDYYAVRLPLLLLFRAPVEPPLVVEVYLLLRPQSGTACQKQSVLQRLWQCSGRHWRWNSSRDLTPTYSITNFTNTWLIVRFPFVPWHRRFGLISR